MVQNTQKIFDARGKWIGWSNQKGQIYWGHGDWVIGKGTSKYPHLNYDIDGVKGHLFLLDKITNKRMLDDFTISFGL